jgi:hypothetical protein
MAEAPSARADEAQESQPCRAITLTRLPDRTVVMDVGDARVVLSETEFEKLSFLIASEPAKRGRL